MQRRRRFTQNQNLEVRLAKRQSVCARRLICFRKARCARLR